MARTIRTNNKQQKNIIKMLDSLTGKYSRWEVWNDFLTMAAVAICNSFWHQQWEEREKMYKQCAEKYTDAEIKIFNQMFEEMVTALDDNSEQDFLGELFMALEISNEWRGQFFTLYNICRMTAKINLTEDAKKEIEQKGFANVNDPACGAGALLIAYANACKVAGINYQQHVFFVAQDVDLLAGMMCYIQLSLLGCPGYVAVQNTLTNPIELVDKRGLIPKDSKNVWYTPMFFSDIWADRRQIAFIDSLIGGEANG